MIRQQWLDELKNKNVIHLMKEVDGQKLYEQLDDLQSQALSGDKLKTKAKETIEKYIQDAPDSNTTLQNRK